MQYEISRVSLLGNRKTNQDRLGVTENKGGVVLILGDGLGGKPGGELASETFVKSVQHSLRHEVMPTADPKKLLKELIVKAHYAVRAAGHKQTPPVEPGSTAVLCLIQNNKAWWAHVGDSRLYLLRDGLTIYRTKDDSFVERLYQRGEISIETRNNHPMRNYVTQCIGLMDKEPKVNISNGVEVQANDSILLCSDGFWEPLDDAQIGANLAEGDFKKSVLKLATLAEQNSYPKSDNTTALAIKIISIQNTEKKTTPTKKKGDTQDAPLDGAIQEIEDAINFYKDEMDK